MLMLDVSMQVGAAANQQVADPYANEPKRHPALVVRSQQPFNAETPVNVLGTSGLTPNELFYVRNHLPVPHVEPASWSVSLTSALQFRVCHLECKCPPVLVLLLDFQKDKFGAGQGGG